MFRAACSALITTSQHAFRNINNVSKVLTSLNHVNQFGTFTRLPLSITAPKLISSPCISLPIQPVQPTLVPSRNVTKFSMQKGKRKSVKAVVEKFFRLHWGGWIRTRAGRNRKQWSKSSSNKRRARQHVFCNAKQSWLLDSMVTKFWRKPKYYVDDPYEPYHTRSEFPRTSKVPTFRE